MLIPVLKKVAVAVAIASSMGSAGAVSINFGTLTTTVAASDLQVSGSFNDVFSFTLGSGSGVQGSVVGIDLIGDLMGQYRFGVGTTPVWGSFSSLISVPSDADTGLFEFSQTLTGLTPGTKYWINLKGTGTDASYSLTLAPVPEPETYAMLLAGLGLMGTIARRRKVAPSLEGV